MFWSCLQGLVNDKEFMEKILKEHQIDIVISAVGGGNILDQLTLIEAIKTVGTIKVKASNTYQMYNRITQTITTIVLYFI